MLKKHNTDYKKPHQKSGRVSDKHVPPAAYCGIAKQSPAVLFRVCPSPVPHFRWSDGHGCEGRSGAGDEWRGSPPACPPFRRIQCKEVCLAGEHRLLRRKSRLVTEKKFRRGHQAVLPAVLAHDLHRHQVLKLSVRIMGRCLDASQPLSLRKSSKLRPSRKERPASRQDAQCPDASQDKCSAVHRPKTSLARSIFSRMATPKGQRVSQTPHFTHSPA